MDRQLGAFEILSDPDPKKGFHRLGEGTFGITYKARHRLGHEVALKILKFDQNDPKAARFENEAKVLYTLRHPHIATFLHYDIHKGFPYCCMEFCGGGDLQSISHERGGLPAAVVMEIGQQVCSALVYAHGRPSGGVVHRDIKPENLMLGQVEDGVLGVKVIDFGLAKVYTEEQGSPDDVMQSAEGFKGTSLFASPEQWREGEIDGRADLYSLGMTLWYLVCGGKPPAFEGKRLAEVSSLHLSAQAFDLEGVDPALRPILERLLAKNTDDRFPDAAAAQEAFAAGLRGLDGEVPRPGLAAFAKIPDPPRRELIELLPRLDVAFADSGYELKEKWWDASVGPVIGCRTPSGQDVALLFLEDGRQLRLTHLERSTFYHHSLQLERAVQTHSLPAAVIGAGRLRWFADDVTVVELEPLWAVPLLEVIRHRRKLPFSESLLLLQHLAVAMDYLAEHRFPVPDLTDSRLLIALEPASFREIESFIGCEFAKWPRFVLKVLPFSIGAAGTDATVESADVGATFDALEESAALNGLARFAAKIYSLVAGHQVAQAAYFAPEAYSEIPGLSADGNALLRNVIAARGSLSASCRELLLSLCRAEGMAPPDLLSAGTLVTSDMFRSQPLQHDPLPGLSSVDASRAPMPSLAVDPGQDSLPSTAVPERATRDRRIAVPRWLGMTALLITAGMAGWICWTKFRPTPTALAIQPAITTEPPPPATAPAITPSPDTAPIAPTSKPTASAPPSGTAITVPDDVATIAGALAAAADGATITVRGGAYRESVQILRPVSIIGSEQAEVVLIAPSETSSALMVKHAKGVRLERLTFQHPGDELNGGSFPPVVHGEHSEITLVDCTIAGAAEDGIRLTGEGITKLERTAVVGNAKQGLVLERGAQITAVDCRFERNGSSGLLAQFGGASAILSGCFFLTNGHSGVEITRGAQAEIDHCHFLQNQGAGVFVNGSSSQAKIEASELNKNKLYGLHVTEGGILQAVSNEANENGESGFFLLNPGSNCTLVGNQSRNNIFYGVFFGAKTGVSASIKANICNDNGYSGIVGDGPVTLSLDGNQCHGNKEHGIILGNGVSGELSANQCNRNSRHGIALDGVAATLVVGENQTSANGDSGFFRQ